MMRGGDEADRATDTIGMHLLQGICQEGMPVAHADVDRQRVAGSSKPLAQAVGLSLRERGQR